MSKRWEWARGSLIALMLGLAGGCSAEPAECTAGMEGCPCESGDGCDDGLVCSEQTCRAPREVALSVDHPGARACEVLLRDAGDEVASVRFEGASGAHVREEPLTALSFSAGADAPIAGGAVRVQLVGDGSAFTIERSRCFDTAGQLISGASVRIGG